jgi:hypothetical protein
LPAADRADKPASLGAVEHDGRHLTVPEGAAPDQGGLSDRTHVRAMLVGIHDERRTELRGERSEGAVCLRALLERARVAPAGGALSSRLATG